MNDNLGTDMELQNRSHSPNGGNFCFPKSLMVLEKVGGEKRSQFMNHKHITNRIKKVSFITIFLGLGV